jgi:hypothetical protein
MKKFCFGLAVLLTASLLWAGEVPAKGKGKKGRVPPEPPSAERSFNKLDVNGDGRLTLAEYSADKTDKAEAEKKFKSLDKNGDGELTRQEFAAGWTPPPADAAPAKKHKKNR